MIKQKACKDCGKKFDFDTHARYPRKYCKKCSAERKKAWDNQWKVKYTPDDDD